jgi:hypothetical protein
MGTTPATPKPNVGTVLNSLSQVGGYIGLAVQIGQVLVPIGVAAVKKIKDSITGVETISYQLLVTEDQATLASVDAASTADLTAINAELVRQGASPLPIPPPAGS